MNACCGHGVASAAYIQFPDGRVVQHVVHVQEQPDRWTGEGTGHRFSNPFDAARSAALALGKSAVSWQSGGSLSIQTS